MRSRVVSLAIVGLAALGSGWWQTRAPGGDPLPPGMVLRFGDAGAAAVAAPGHGAAASRPADATTEVRNPAAPGQAGQHAVVVAYFYDTAARRYMPVALRLPRPAPVAAAATAAYNALCSGPPAAARAAGYVTALPPGCRVERARLAGSTLELTVNPEFTQAPARLAQRWADQVELTAAQFPAIRAVALRVGEQAVDQGPGGLPLPLRVDGRPGAQAGPP